MTKFGRIPDCITVLDHIACSTSSLTTNERKKEMANVEDIKQQLAKAEKQLEEAKAEVKEFKEGRYGQQMTVLEDKSWGRERLDEDERENLKELKEKEKQLDEWNREVLKSREELRHIDTRSSSALYSVLKDRGGHIGQTDIINNLRHLLEELTEIPYPQTFSFEVKKDLQADYKHVLGQMAEAMALFYATRDQKVTDNYTRKHTYFSIS